MKHKFYTVKKILVWEPNWIGDVVLSIPLINSLKKKYPQAEITAVVKSPGEEILKNNPYVSKVEIIPEKFNLGFLLSLRKKNFDLAIVLPNSFKSALSIFISGAKIRVGYNTEMRSFFLTHIKEVDSREKHISKYFLELLSLIECPVETRFPEIFSKGNEDDYLGFFRQNEIKEEDFLIALHPGSSKEPRAWELKKFGLLCQELIKDYQAKIIVLGNKSEKNYYTEIRKHANENVLNAMGNNLLETAAIIHKCKIFIGNDSGIMHIAAAVNTPVVGIFGPGAKERTGPLLDNMRFEIVSKDYPCSPCRQKFFEECEASSTCKAPCIAEITVEDVFTAVKAVIQRNV